MGGGGNAYIWEWNEDALCFSLFVPLAAAVIVFPDSVYAIIMYLHVQAYPQDVTLN